MSLQIEVGVAKTNKYASRESGDTAEVIERPGGGLSIVLADGQGSGTAAKLLSMQVTASAASLVKEGVRDGVVARAAHDMLFFGRQGKVQASLDIVSGDLRSGGIIVTRNSTTPLIVRDANGVRLVESNNTPIGLYQFTKPQVLQFPMAAGLMVIAMTDGVVGAGNRYGLPPIQHDSSLALVEGSKYSAKEIADAFLRDAIERDRGRPLDDMTVAVMRITEHEQPVLIRHLEGSMPLP